MVTRSMRPQKLDSEPMGICAANAGAEKALLHRVDAWKKSAPTRSNLLMKAMRGTLYFCSLTPHGLGLGLDAGDGVEHGDGTVKDAQAALDLGREVNVPGCR